MSRAYKISLKQREKHGLRASDEVGTSLELLEILPPERMADLLAQELKRRGFVQRGDKLLRNEKGGITIEVDPKTADVTVKVECEKTVTLEAERQTWADSPSGSAQNAARKAMKEELQRDLQRKAELQKAELQKRATDRLEAQLSSLRKELDQAVNRVTAEALKEKAAKLGQIKQISEDAQTGSLTIVLEV